MLQLREYQKEDIARGCKHHGFGIFNEQRTGKTPTAIRIAAELKLSRFLVVCPKSAVYQWKSEVERWSDYPAYVVTGPPKKRHAIIEAFNYGALIISYDNLKTTARTEGDVDKILTKLPELIIADEAHRFKTMKTAVFKAMRKLMKVERRLALSGTPAHGKPEEIFAIVHWIRPDIFKAYWPFIEEYFYKFQRQAAGGTRTFIEIGGFKKGKEAQLQELLSHISTQRKRRDVMAWLPEKDYSDVKLPATPQQTKALEELSKYYETGEVVVQGVLDRLMRYRQICLAPKLIELPGPSPKLDWILDYVDDYPDTPTIIFSKFTSFLKMVAEALAKKEDYKFGMIIGDTSAQLRSQNVQAFQQGACTMLLINIDAGKEALTLDRGECIIFTDQYPPAADIQQAEDRFVATTPDKADKPHKIIRLMIEGTYDEQVYKLVEQRASVIDLLNDYNKYLK